MSEDSKVVNLSDRSPHIPSEHPRPLPKLQTTQEELEEIEIATEESYALHTAKKVQELKRNFDHANNQPDNVQQIKSVLTGLDRGIALLQPYLFPEEETYDGQYKDSLKIIEARKKQINRDDLNINGDDFIYPEISTLAILGKDLLDKPELREQLTQEEIRYIEEINNAYRSKYIDLTGQHAVIVLFQIEEKLQNIRTSILNGTLNPKDDALKQKLDNIFEMVQTIDANETDIERDLLEIYQDVGFLVQTALPNDAVWYLNPLQHPHFDVEETSEYLHFCGIPDTKSNIEISSLMIDNISQSYKLPPHAAFKHYAERSLGALRKFIEFHPNADEDIITYALFEDLLIDESFDSSSIDPSIANLIAEVVSEEQMEKFEDWKYASQKVGARFSNDSDDIKDQLETFYACKNLMNLYKYKAHLELPPKRHPLIGEDIFDAEAGVAEISPDNVPDAYLNAEIEAIGEELNNKLELLHIAGFEGTPPPEEGYGEMDSDDPTEPKTEIKPVKDTFEKATVTALTNQNPPSKSMTDAERILWIQQQHQEMENGTYQAPSITNDQTAYERALILVQPFKFPDPETQPGQHRENLYGLIHRDVQLNHYNEHLDPEIRTLILVGAELRENPELAKHLTSEEKLYLEEAKDGYKANYIDMEFPHALLMMYDIQEELDEIYEDILSGTLAPENLALKDRLEDIQIMMDGLNFQTSHLERDLFSMYQNIDVLRFTDSNHEYLWPLDVIKSPEFSIIENLETLESCGIPATDDAIYTFDNAIAYISNEHTKSPSLSMHDYARRGLGTLKEFVQHCPNSDPDIITYGLIEDLMVNVEVSGIVDATMTEDLMVSLTEDQVGKFKTWKNASKDKENGFSEFQTDLQQQLETFYACKSMTQLYMYDANIELNPDACPLIREDMYDAGKILDTIDLESIQCPALHDRLAHIADKVKNRINDLEKQGYQPISTDPEHFDYDPTTPPDSPNAGKPTLTIV